MQTTDQSFSKDKICYSNLILKILKIVIRLEFWAFLNKDICYQM